MCRQLGFPHGTRVDPLTADPPPPEGDSSPYTTFYYKYYYQSENPEEAEEPVERFWLREVAYSGPEARLVDCDPGRGYIDNIVGCSYRLQVLILVREQLRAGV